MDTLAKPMEGIGTAVRRREDARFLTGRGRFVADLVFPGVLHCAVVRSPHAHARIRRIELAAAQAARQWRRREGESAEVMRAGALLLAC